MNCSSPTIRKRIKELEGLIPKTQNINLKKAYIKEYNEFLECNTIYKNTDLDEELIKLRLFEHKYHRSTKTLEECSIFLLELELLRNNYEILNDKIQTLEKNKELYINLMTKITDQNNFFVDLIYDHCETLRF